MLGYLYIIASAQQEFSLSSCLAYDVAFRKKAAQLHLPSWGIIDPQTYARAFTGVNKARAGTLCSICLDPTHSTSECTLYSGGPAKRPRASQAGPKRNGPLTSAREICLNFNRGRCAKEDCPRAHACSFRGCGGQHPDTRCTLRRSLPRKA